MTFIKGETVLFTASADASLAFPPLKIQRIYNSAIGIDFRTGRDIEWTPGCLRLTRPAGSAVPYLTHDDLYPPADQAVFYPAQGANAVSGGPNGAAIRFDSRDFFARHQLEVDYWTEAPIPPLTVLTGKLPRFRSNPALKLAFVGDSITEGANASKFVGVPPFQPSYAELTAANLHAAETRNFAVGGTGCLHGIIHLESWLNDFLPDLMFVAYGMNDLTGMTPAKFRSSIMELISIARRYNPVMEFVLIGSMPGNAEWKCTPPAATRAFAGELDALAKTDAGIAFIDIGGYWEKYFANKKFWDLTGNGVNHPNDFGHRFYAETIADALALN